MQDSSVSRGNFLFTFFPADYSLVSTLYKYRHQPYASISRGLRGAARRGLRMHPAWNEPLCISVANGESNGEEHGT